MAQPLSNQLVSFTDAQSIGLFLAPGQVAVTDNLIMTKTDATTKYVIDANAMAPYASNQCPPRSAFVNGCPSYYILPPTTLIGFDPTLDDYSQISFYNCVNNFTQITVYYGQSIVYFDALSIQLFYTTTDGSYGLGGPS